MSIEENYNTPNSGCCGRPMQYAKEPQCNYTDACMDEYCCPKLTSIEAGEPDCKNKAVIPSVTVDSVEGITNLANCFVHVNDINTTFYIDDKHRIMITWAGPVDVPGYDMEHNPEGFRDQIITDKEKGIAVIYDKSGKGFTFGIYESLNVEGAIDTAITNKLNEMAQDGTIADIITSYLKDAILGFDTVADMKIATNLVAGSFAQTLGYYSKNDGGAGLYKIRTITESDVIEEALLIALTDTSLVAELIVEDHITPEQFGCYGDGTHDDTTNLQKAINTGYSIKAGKTYNITNVSMANISFDLFGTINGHVSLGKYVTLKGGNINGTTDSPVITVENDNDSIRSMETYIENVKITPTADGIGIYLDATEHSMFNTFISDCEIVSGSIGIKFENANSHWITQTILENIYLHSPTTGLKFINTGTIVNMTDIVLKDVYAQFYNHKPVNFIDADLVRLDLYNCKCYDGIEDAIYKVTNSSSLIYVNNSAQISANTFNADTDPKVLRFNSLASSDGGSILRVNKGIQYLPTITNGVINPAASSTTGIALPSAQFLGFVGKAGSNISSSSKYSSLGFQNGRLSCGYSDTTTLADFKTVEVTTPYSGGVYTTDTLPSGSDVRNGATCWCSDIHMAVTMYSNKWYKPDGTELTV